ncbi:hypothetical protein EUX98_g3273 [Antrodiella citrinella]|uniref:GOLD domain-containing protein n=1 Tax=Antrodiella citrinella TaxID=2447956 RepID=A0A4S4MWX1_9APHY|nr:hypothetical protein EUX98_g3273 [Antrodiella citrinella]
MSSRHPRRSPLQTIFFLFAAVIIFAYPVQAIKFEVPAYRYPPSKCIWNAAHPGALIIVTANVGPGDDQRIDIEIVDGGADKNTYLHKKGIKGESRFAVTAHTEGDVGVCFRNYLETTASSSKTYARVIDLDVDIGADAVDYNAIANQESLSALETEMRKLEGIVKEIVDELEYLKTREERFQSTNLKAPLPAAMLFKVAMFGFVVSRALATLAASGLVTKAIDPCATIAGQKWVAPKDVRACFTSFSVDPAIKTNIIDVVNKTLAFHTSVNFEKRAPEPFTADVHEDLLADFARISVQSYASELDLHIDMSRTLKRLNDGHCVYINSCFDSVFLTFVPTPLVLLTNTSGAQNVHIAPEAFTVASAEFADELSVWQDALPGNLKGKLSSLSGAKVLKINGADPFDAVDANALITGSFQGFGTRQNSFFATYNLGSTGFTYSMGNFGQLSLPLADSVTLEIQRNNSITVDTITLPYRSRIAVTTTWTDTASYRQSLCVAQSGTNGADLSVNNAKRNEPTENPLVSAFQQQPNVSPADRQRHALNVMLDTTRQQDIAFPPVLTPVNPVSGSAGVAQFFMLDDQKTGILALGSFSDTTFDGLEQAMISGLQSLKSAGATQLIVDVTGNGGGFICLAHWLHRILVGPKSTTFPQAGLDTMVRAGPLAQLIVQRIVQDDADPFSLLNFNPLNWQFPNGTHFTADHDWLLPLQTRVINGRQDAFSPRMADQCQPFDIDPPTEALFDPKKTAIVSNGRCASSCSLFSVTMAKKEGAKMVVVGGKKDVQQQYCGTVGGQSTDFSDMDTEVKTTGLKNNTLAPPDFLTNSVQGITWRLGFGVVDPTQPEGKFSLANPIVIPSKLTIMYTEWQTRPADVNLPLTADIVNNPFAIWKQIAKTVL